MKWNRGVLAAQVPPAWGGEAQGAAASHSLCRAGRSGPPQAICDTCLAFVERETAVWGRVGSQACCVGHAGSALRAFRHQDRAARAAPTFPRFFITHPSVKEGCKCAPLLANKVCSRNSAPASPLHFVPHLLPQSARCDELGGAARPGGRGSSVWGGREGPAARLRGASSTDRSQ